MIDRVFTKNKKFKFDEEVASVFDDMLNRSIPMYQYSLDLISNFILQHTKKDDTIIDIGCSTGNLLQHIYTKSNIDLNLIGIDNSPAMISQAIKKSNAYNSKIKYLLQDCITYKFPTTNFIVANYTMQFIPLQKRVNFLKNIFSSLLSGGFFIFSEKIVYENDSFNKNIIDIYHNFKKQNGYSELEIANKKEALEDVLLPLTQKQNKELLKTSGFNLVETIFKWGNFVVFVAKKQ